VVGIIPKQPDTAIPGFFLRPGGSGRDPPNGGRGSPPLKRKRDPSPLRGLVIFSSPTGAAAEAPDPRRSRQPHSAPNRDQTEVLMCCMVRNIVMVRKVWFVYVFGEKTEGKKRMIECIKIFFGAIWGLVWLG